MTLCFQNYALDPCAGLLVIQKVNKEQQPIKITVSDSRCLRNMFGGVFRCHLDGAISLSEGTLFKLKTEG